MKKIIFIVTLVLISFYSLQVFAIPTLQLDIEGGVYYDGPTGTYDTETIIDTGNDGIFTVYALLTPKNPLDEYRITPGDDNDAYLSVALFPQREEVAADLGSFTVNGGDPIHVTSGMEYGTPNITTEDPDYYLTWSLPTHGIFDTYYTEIGFDWDPALTSAAYNSQDNPGGPTSGTGAYYVAFDVDASGLSGLYSLHFDLYSADFDGDGKVEYVAPFSHDAQSTSVPEPATMLLLGTGLIGLAGTGRRKYRKS
jgi:hypothetical protein